MCLCVLFDMLCVCDVFVYLFVIILYFLSLFQVTILTNASSLSYSHIIHSKSFTNLLPFCVDVSASPSLNHHLSTVPHQPLPPPPPFYSPTPATPTTTPQNDDRVATRQMSNASIYHLISIIPHSHLCHHHHYNSQTTHTTTISHLPPTYVSTNHHTTLPLQKMRTEW